MSALNDPRHPRYRTYCYLQAASSERVSATEHGRYSAVRCLHCCNDGTGKGRWTPDESVNDRNLPIIQAFADYYNVEVLHFEEYWQPNPANPNDLPFDNGDSRGPPNAARQIYIIKAFSHHTPCQRPAGTPPNWKLVIPRPAHERVGVFPWHPPNRQTMTLNDLPPRLPRRMRFSNQGTRASQEEVNRVLANRHYPDEMPILPLTRAEMDNDWQGGAVDPAAVPYPNRRMPTRPGSYAAVGDPPLPNRANWG